MSINANNYKVLASAHSSFYVLSDKKGRFFARDFDKPSTEHTMFCTSDIREATRYETKEKAEEAKTHVLSWHCTEGDVNKLAKIVVSECEPLHIYHTERFEVPKETMVRDAEFEKTANAFSEIFGG